jgi:hypothetical protein
MSTSVTQGLVLKLKSDNSRYTSARQDVASESTLPTNTETRGFTGKVGGFLGGKMFDYFLTRFVTTFYEVLYYTITISFNRAS